MRVNHRIRVPEIRVIGSGGEQMGIMQTHVALAQAKENGLDLVEIAPRERPPVCKIMDYGKFKYEQSKKKKQARKSSSTIELKELKFRPKTEGHDMDFKIRHARRFLEDGNKCRLVIIFRGREITHPETGVNVLNKVVEATKDIGVVELKPNMEGRRMVMIIAPNSETLRKAKQRKQEEAKKAAALPPAKVRKEAERAAQAAAELEAANKKAESEAEEAKSE